jgi:hypothetical protein
VTPFTLPSIDWIYAILHAVVTSLPGPRQIDDSDDGAAAVNRIVRESLSASDFTRFISPCVAVVRETILSFTSSGSTHLQHAIIGPFPPDSHRLANQK